MDIYKISLFKRRYYQYGKKQPQNLGRAGDRRLRAGGIRGGSGRIYKKTQINKSGCGRRKSPAFFTLILLTNPYYAGIIKKILN